MLLRPQIITNTEVLATLVSPSGARNAAMLGSATWGPINAVTIISSMTEFVSIFGDDISGSTGLNMTLIKGAEAFFNNGGTLKVVRLDDGTALEANYMALSTATDVIDFIAKFKGTYGNNVLVTVTTIGANRGLEVTDGKTQEIYTNGSTGYATNQALADAVNASSNLITAAVETGEETQNLVDAFTATALTGGLNGATLTNTIIGTALDDLLLTESYNFLLVPGWTVDGDQNVWAGKLESRASSEKKYSRYITGVAVDEDIATANARISAGKRISVKSPGIKYTHRIDGIAMVLDGSYQACAYAGKLCALDLEISGTHETIAVEGLSVLQSSGKEYFSKAEQEQLLQGRISPASLIGNAIQCVRGVTRATSTTDIFFEEVVVDIVDYTLEQCETYLDTTIGKPNTVESRNAYSAQLDAILQVIKDEGIIEDFQDSSVVLAGSPDTYNAVLSVKPTVNTNFINLTIEVQ